MITNPQFFSFLSITMLLLLLLFSVCFLCVCSVLLCCFVLPSLQCSVTLFQYALRGDLGTYLYLMTDEDDTRVRRTPRERATKLIDPTATVKYMYIWIDVSLIKATTLR